MDQDINKLHAQIYALKEMLIRCIVEIGHLSESEARSELEFLTDVKYNELREETLIQ